MLGCDVVELQMNQTELELELVVEKEVQERILGKIGNYYERYSRLELRNWNYQAGTIDSQSSPCLHKRIISLQDLCNHGAQHVLRTDQFALELNTKRTWS